MIADLDLVWLKFAYLEGSKDRNKRGKVLHSYSSSDQLKAVTAWKLSATYLYGLAFGGLKPPSLPSGSSKTNFPLADCY